MDKRVPTGVLQPRRPLYASHTTSRQLFAQLDAKLMHSLTLSSRMTKLSLLPELGYQVVKFYDAKGGVALGRGSDDGCLKTLVGHAVRAIQFEVQGLY